MAGRRGLIGAMLARKRAGWTVLAVLFGAAGVVGGLLLGGAFLRYLVVLLGQWWPVVPEMSYWTAVWITVFAEFWVAAIALVQRVLGLREDPGQAQRCEAWRYQD